MIKMRLGTLSVMRRKVIGEIAVLAVMREIWRSGGRLENLAGLIVLDLVVDRDFGLLRIECVDHCYKRGKVIAARLGVRTTDQNMLEIHLLSRQHTEKLTAQIGGRISVVVSSIGGWAVKLRYT